jgi:NADP-dependent 3-hydroxy acid dehydrogenase YdfG
MLKMTRVMNCKLLKDKVAIVTGASGNLGFAISKELAQRGASDNVRSSMASVQKSDSLTLTEGKKAATENSMKRWADTRELDTIAASILSEDFVFAIGNTIVIDGGTVIL